VSDQEFLARGREVGRGTEVIGCHGLLLGGS
jgi:hypothetical protein